MSILNPADEKGLTGLFRMKMQIWKWLILSVAFVVTSSCCNALSLPQMVKQTKNQTEHLARESPLANVTVYQQGHFENSSNAQGLRRNSPEFSAPLDPLSRSYLKVKKDKRRQRKMPQKQPGQKDKQIMPGESSNFKILRAGDEVQLADNVESTPMHQPNAKPNGHTDILAFERNPTHYVRTKVPKKRGQSGTFGLPIDRIGHLPKRRGKN
ncbi:uncharacterized protein LOC130553975 isoform X3 [Triplophysa rosa]|uniref:uncharacterized protein LOC130553975 isoform X3 n=1 Tax=Triplophysa rosa TaxID=992332 RepID=UPI00254615B7|nr:uncharacterized protein LOC130553975 isoform X3 [Triplophysa rosa]